MYICTCVYVQDWEEVDVQAKADDRKRTLPTTVEVDDKGHKLKKRR